MDNFLFDFYKVIDELVGLIINYEDITHNLNYCYYRIENLDNISSKFNKYKKYN